MVVTAYSPDERSCGDSADGITATLHSVQTNDFALVAADPSILRYGTMLTVPGYDQDRIVPVLDRGGAIKGRRLDVLYPTHEEARRWGRQSLTVTVWEYADGLPPENPRRVR
jgi:3D (Asp-Asp-Asp) domain-containing protein